MFEAMVIGAGATAFLDVYAVARSWLFGSPPPDYALVGRWIGHMARGRFMHDAIARSAQVAGERAIGWIAHYATGVAFAAILIFIFGDDWLREPTLIPALIVGIGSVAAPFLLMQPGMGAGIAGCRTPNPNATRIRSITTHAVFGIGLYAAGWAVHLFDFTTRN